MRVSIAPFVALVIACSGGAALATDPGARPNILLLLVDDLNCDIACYGATDVATPNIDALASRGVRFTRAYAQGAACNPSRASLLTGRSPLATGVLDNRSDYRVSLPDAITLARYFKEHGYVTVLTGKVSHRGFEDMAAWDIVAGQRAKLERPQKRGAQQRSRGKSMDRWGISSSESGEELGDFEVASAAIRLIDELPPQPFFVAVGLESTHAPLVAPRRYFDSDANSRAELPADFAPIPLGSDPIRRDNPGLFYNRRAEFGEARQMLRAYRATTSFVDAQVGRVLTGLEQAGHRDDTVVVLASDHGYHLGEKGYWGKSTLFDRGLRVPLIFAGPGVLAHGVSDRTVQLMDLYPTLLEMARLSLPDELDGRSLVPLLTDPAEEWPFPARSWLKRGGVMAASIRTEDYRYTEWAGGSRGRELYDHRTDPREEHNLANDSEQRDLVRGLGMLLDSPP